ncbi:MAG: HAD family hydrolase [Rhodospirillales bacterium]
MAAKESNRLCVFDCDGTLVDSQYSVIACMRAAFQSQGWPPPPDGEVRRLVGLPLLSVIRLLAPGCGETEYEAAAAVYKHTFEHSQGGTPDDERLYPGTEDILRRLNSAGWLLGVATGKGRRGLDITLHRYGFDEMFVTLQTADSARGKPDPDMLHRAMAEAGAAPETTIMVGDTTYDIEMARRAGTASAGVSWGYHPADELRTAGADFIIDEWAALTGVLDQRFGAGTAT